MARPPSPKATRGGRRNFLKHAGLAGAAALAAPAGAAAAPQAPAPDADQPFSVAANAVNLERSGSDYMLDVIKSLGFEFVCANPGSSFRAIHESVINYGGNKAPELITCTHEESSVAMAHGYYKIEGKPAMVMAHGTVGLQHAAMALYNAWCDRVPVYMVIGNSIDANERRPKEWAHSVQDAALMVRDFTKWDDSPGSLQHFAESAIRAYQISMTPPRGATIISADLTLQEKPIAPDFKLPIPKMTLPAIPQGDSGAVAEIAKLLVAAENPVLVADRLARTPAGMTYLVELAETLQAGVVDLGSRLNFPTRHPLNQTVVSRATLSNADVILALEVQDIHGTLHVFRDQVFRSARPIHKSSTKLVSINSGDLYIRANYQDFQRFIGLDIAVAAEAEATMPLLIEAVKRLVTPDRKRAFEARGARLAKASQAALERSRVEASYAWDASPVSTGRLCAEIWDKIRHEDWSLVSSWYSDGGGWPRQLWTFDKPYHWIGHAGGGGIGYGAPAAVGAALANRKHGRLSVAIQTDGDLMYAPGVLWTAAHHKIPLLSIMHNNRRYHMEMMHVQRIANRKSRGVDRCLIGNEIDNPAIDYSKLAQSLGVYGEGPITNPKDLGPAIARALAVVKKGEPALVDVFTQPR
ncbi:MAG: thiamine pyrophosphate-dependent enzyme [Acidobacteriota bacterium]